MFRPALTPVVQALLTHYFATFLTPGSVPPSVLSVDLGPVSSNNFLIVVGMALIVILGWWWAIRTLREQLAASKTLRELRALSPDAFEEWVAARFRNLGYTTKLTGTTGDHGIDIVTEKTGERAVVQCKRYAGSVGEGALRDLYGTMHGSGAARAYMVTTGWLTQPAADWARDKPALVIWDGEYLARLSIGLPGRNKRRHAHAITPGGAVGVGVDGEGSVSITSEPTTANCPKCGSVLVERRNRRTGVSFLGCLRYPNCRYTRPVHVC